MNALEITWAIIFTDKPKTKKMLNKLFRLGIYEIATFDNGYYFHNGNKEFAESRVKTAIKILNENEVTGEVFFITDKQFGLSINTWGTSEIVEIKEPFHKGLLLKDRTHRMGIPVTEKQLEDVIKF